jgi:hypothetical protein
MNEFLLLALAIIYLVISYGATSTGARTDSQGRYNEPSAPVASRPDAERDFG